MKSLILILFSLPMFAQVGIGNTNPQGALDISSSTDGLLIPRVSLTSTVLSVPVITPTISELVYNDNTAGAGLTAVTPGYYFWSGSAWNKLTTSTEWSLTGNSGTNVLNNFVGTIDNVGLRFRTNNINRFEIENDGQVYVRAASPYASDLFSSTGAANAFPINGYASGSGWGIYGEATAGGIGVAGAASSGTATGVAGTNGTLTIQTLTGGSGVAGSGNTTGIYGAVKNTTGTRQAGYFACVNSTASTANDPIALLAGEDASAIYGGYFDSKANANTYAYVGLRFGGTNYKILGGGSVSTIVKDTENNGRVLFAPETPEIVFQDFGVGKLIDGQARINIDEILSKNIFVDEKHPLKVFIQLEGDSKGVYVTDKSSKGFLVKELQNGKGNFDFSWQIVATRANTVGENGDIESKHVDVRFPDAPGSIVPKETINIDKNLK